MSDIVERLRDPRFYGQGLGLSLEAADEIEKLRIACQDLEEKVYGQKSEIERLQAERDNWEAVCSGSLKEQFRLARENEARLKLALDQLDKAAAEIKRLHTELAKRDDVIKRRDERCDRIEAKNARLRTALREDRKECAIETLVSDPDEGLPTAEDVRGILKPGKNER